MEHYVQREVECRSQKDVFCLQVAGGGRSSARETIGRVAAGAIAKKVLRLVAGVEVSSTL